MLFVKMTSYAPIYFELPGLDLDRLIRPANWFWYRSRCAI